MNDTEELWQEYNEQGEPIGQGVTKTVGRTGALHGAAHVWIWRRDGDQHLILLQKRADDKPTWPGFLDISAAGHMSFGETPLQTAVREAQEELGLNIDVSALHFICTYRQHSQFEQIIENEIVWMYSLELAIEQDFSFSDQEVSEARWVTLDYFKKLITQDVQDEKLVQQGEVYSAELLRGLELHWTGK